MDLNCVAVLPGMIPIPLSFILIVKIWDFHFYQKLIVLQKDFVG